MIPVKICGITNLQDALTCQEHGVTALGFVFAPSKRQVNVAQVYEITRQLSPDMFKIGVFVDEDPCLIKEIMKECDLDLAQLHGAETPDVCELLEGRVIKAFRAGWDYPDLVWRGASLKGVLVDAYSATAAGGTGKAYDWSLATAFKQLGFPLILAGGLNHENIRQAIRTVRPDGVDLSSGVEQRPGLKDPELLAKLMEQIMSD